MSYKLIIINYRLQKGPEDKTLHITIFHNLNGSTIKHIFREARTNRKPVWMKTANCVLKENKHICRCIQSESKMDLRR